MKNEESITIFSMLMLSIIMVIFLPEGHDIEFHYYRISSMASEIVLNGFTIPLRILSATYDGYGYATPLFYGDLLLYLPAFLVMMGVNIKVSYLTLVFGIWFGSFYIMKHMVYRVTEEVQFGIYAASIYAFSPYFLMCLWTRAAIGEASAFLYLPIIFLSYYEILYKSKKNDWILLSVGMVGLLLAHNISTILVTAALLIWSIIEIKKILTKKVICKLTKAISISIILSASYLFPMIEAMLFQEHTLGDKTPEYFVELSQMMLRGVFVTSENQWILKSLFGFNAVEMWAPYGFGLFIVLILFWIIRFKNIGKNKLILNTAILSVLLYFCCFVPDILRIISIVLSNIQFAWRLLLLSTFGLTIYGAYLLNHKYKELKQKTENGKEFNTLKVSIMMVILIGIYIISGNLVIGINTVLSGNYCFNSVDAIDNGNYENFADTLYLPLELLEEPLFYSERGETIISNNAEVEYLFHRSGTKIIIDVIDNEFEDTILELPLVMYKGYSAVDNQGDEYKIVKSDNGYVSVIVGNQEELEITVEYTGTLIQHVSDRVTAIGGIVISAYFLVLYLSKRKILRII